MINQSKRSRCIISNKEFRDPKNLAELVIHQIKMYVLKCKNINLDWRNHYKYKHAFNSDMKGSHLIFKDLNNNIIWVRSITSETIGIKINSTDELRLNLLNASYYTDFKLWRNLINYKLTVVFREVNFGKRLPYSKSSTHMKSLESIEHQLNRFKISLDEPEWDHILIEKLEKLGSRKYRGFIKAFEAANALYDYYLYKGYSKNLSIRYALFIRLYQESRVSGSWAHQYRFQNSTDKSIIDRISIWNSHRGLNWNTTMIHLNKFYDYMGYKGRIPYTSFDWMPANKFVTDPWNADVSLLGLLDSFYSPVGKKATQTYHINLGELTFIIKRFFNSWYKSIIRESNGYHKLNSELRNLADKINRFEYSKCHVTI